VVQRTPCEYLRNTLVDRINCPVRTGYAHLPTAQYWAGFSRFSGRAISTFIATMKRSIGTPAKKNLPRSLQSNSRESFRGRSPIDRSRMPCGRTETSGGQTIDRFSTFTIALGSVLPTMPTEVISKSVPNLTPTLLVRQDHNDRRCQGRHRRPASVRPKPKCERRTVQIKSKPMEYCCAWMF
jgi:hypothetical protein